MRRIGKHRCMALAALVLEGCERVIINGYPPPDQPPGRSAAEGPFADRPCGKDRTGTARPREVILVESVHGEARRCNPQASCRNRQAPPTQVCVALSTRESKASGRGAHREPPFVASVPPRAHRPAGPRLGALSSGC